MTAHPQTKPVFRPSSQLILILVFTVVGIIFVILQRQWVLRNEEQFAPYTLLSQVQKVQCDHCGGTGLLKGSNGVQVVLCPVCFGVGSHLVRKTGTADVLCPACGGMGRLIDARTGEARFCKRCGGRGLITTEPAEPPK